MISKILLFLPLNSHIYLGWYGELSQPWTTVIKNSVPLRITDIFILMQIGYKTETLPTSFELIACLVSHQFWEKSPKCKSSSREPTETRETG